MVRLQEFSIVKSSDQVLTASGGFNRDTKELDIQAKAKNFELREIVLPDGSRLEADVNLSADSSGTLTQPKGTVNLTATDVEYRDQPIGPVAADVKLANGRATFDATLSRGYLEARVQLDRDQADSGVSIHIEVQAGPKLQVVFEGWNVPGSTRDRVRTIWREGVFDAQRIDEASNAIQEALVEDGYLRGHVCWVANCGFFDISASTSATFH